MTKVAVYTNKNGGLSVLIPAKNVYVELATGKFVTTDDDVADLLVDREIPGYHVPLQPEVKSSMVQKALYKLRGQPLPDRPEIPAHDVPPRPIPKTLRVATIEDIAERDIPSGTEYHIIDRADLPQDRTFRNAWKHEEGVVSHDMGKCRELHKEHLRQQRAPLMAQLDLEYMRADEAGDAEKKAAIAAKKQALRDVTKHPDIAAAKTPEELKLTALEALNA